MNEIDLWSIVPVVAVALVALIVLLVILSRTLVNVGAREIAIKERRYLGAKMPPGRVVATEGEVGIQADVLKPGLHFIKYPFERVVRKVPLDRSRRGRDSASSKRLTASRCRRAESSRSTARRTRTTIFRTRLRLSNAAASRAYSFARSRRACGRFIPYLFRVSVAKTTVVPPGKVGVVTAADGAPLDAGRLHGKAIDGHRNFQDAEQYIASGGQKGPQVEILTPGTYRILTNSVDIDNNNNVKPGLFVVRLFDATIISENAIGLVEALDGAPLDPRDYVATPVQGHDNFQDCNEFITGGGQRGPQKDILLPGTYYINPLVFKVIPRDGQGSKAG